MAIKSHAAKASGGRRAMQSTWLSLVLLLSSKNGAQLCLVSHWEAPGATYLHHLRAGKLQKWALQEQSDKKELGPNCPPPNVCQPCPQQIADSPKSKHEGLLNLHFLISSLIQKSRETTILLCGASFPLPNPHPAPAPTTTHAAGIGNLSFISW